MSASLPLILIAFFMAASATGIVGMLIWDRNRRLDDRLRGLSSKSPTPNPNEGSAARTSTSPSAGAVARAFKQAMPNLAQPLMPDEGVERTKLKERLVLAGYYSPQAMYIFLGVKMLLMVTPAMIALLAAAVGMVPLKYGLIFGAFASIIGTIGPSFWLDRKKSKRQATLRRAIPDACDLIVICMEGGLSLGGALSRVIAELRVAHPLLADELNIVQRKAQLGQPLAEALSNFGIRSGVSEIQSLSATVRSAEKFGSSMVHALTNYSETLRVQRQQKAEEMAQQASTKVLFPTLLFIFPSILIVILGPAILQLIAVFSNLNK